MVAVLERGRCDFLLQLIQPTQKQTPDMSIYIESWSLLYSSIMRQFYSLRPSVISHFLFRRLTQALQETKNLNNLIDMVMLLVKILTARKIPLYATTTLAELIFLVS